MQVPAPSSPRPVPHVGVLRDRFQVAATELTSPAPYTSRMPLREALASDYATDAHFVCYDVVGEGFAEWPRLTKRSPVLGQIRTLGGDVLLTVAALDFDNANHRAWASIEEVHETLRHLEQHPFALAQKWTAFYSTRKGFRLVFALAEPMPVDRAEPYLRGLITAFQAAGFDGQDGRAAVDPACKEWNRLFRLPRVLRDGKFTAQEPYYEMFCLDEVLDLALVAPDQGRLGADTSGYAAVEIPDVEKPQGDCYGLLYTVGPDGKLAPNDWLKEARRRLKGRRSFSPLFEHAPLAPRGGRDNAIQSLVGEGIAVLFNLPGTSPELVYALYLDPVAQLEPDAGTPDWTEVLWNAVLRYWTAERSKDEWRKAQSAVRVESVQSRITRMIDGARLWCGDPSLHADDAQATEWLFSHLLATTGQHVWIMQSDGYYDPAAIVPALLPVRIRELAMEQLMPLVAQNDKGKNVVVKPSALIDRHGTLVRDIEGVAGGPGTYLRGASGDRPTLVVRLYRRKSESELEPRYDDDVNEWLDRLGGDQASILKEWIGQSLNFEGGAICALSVAGLPGVGKKMLTQGLAECIDTEAQADGSTFGTYQGRLLKTPFITLDEGIEGVAAKTLADTFRHFTGGDPILVNEKFQPLMLVNAPLRVIATANNNDIVRRLAGERDLSPDDRAALAIRLLHVDATRSTAAAWLRAKGGLSFTAAPGRRWIRGDSGAPSDYILARHFMHLWATRPPVAHGARLLVEGRLESDVLLEMTTRGGSAPAVVEALCRMIEQPRMVREGLSLQDSQVYVTNAGVVAFHRENLAMSSGRRLDVRGVSTTLKGLRCSEVTHSAKLTTSGEKSLTNWTRIDLSILLHEARQHGYPHAQIERLLGEQLKAAHEASLVPRSVRPMVEAAVAAAARGGTGDPRSAPPTAGAALSRLFKT